MSFKMILKYHENYRYPRNMKISNRTKALTDCWDTISLRDLVYNADPRVHCNCFVRSYEDLSYVCSLFQLFC